MPEEASMSFKVYLDLGGGKQEVRRFSLPETVATNYTVLREKICSIFGLSNQDAVLSWKDSDGDSITISTDSELMEAVADSLSNQNVQLVRINVTEGSGRPQPGPSGPQGNQQGDVHLGVTCDACSGRVQGFRYKCVACTDFDLCGACETKGLHKEHKMMRLPKPQDAGGPWFFWKEKEDAPGHFSTHFGMHGNKTGGGTFQSSSSSFSGCDGGAGGAGGAGGCGSSGGPRGRHCFRRGQGGSGKGRGGGWPGWWGRGWGGRNWAGCGQGQTMNSAGCGQGQTMNSDCGGQQQQQQSSQQSPQQQSPQQQSQQQQSQQQSNGGCPFPNIFVSTNGVPQQQSSSQQSQPQQQQQQNNAGYPFPNMFVSAEGVPYPFTAQGEMPNTEQVMEDAKQMAEHVAQHAAQQAHHFASHCASDHVANVMRGIWTAWSGQQGQGQGPNATHSSSSSSSSSHSTSTSRDGAQQEASAGQEKGKEAGQEKSNEAQQNAAGEEYLRSVGETVANLLDPLGIDVEVAVEHNGIRQRCSLGDNGTPASHSSPSPAPTSPAIKPESSPPSVASGGSVHMEVQTDSLSGPQTSGKDVETMDVASPAAPEANPRSVEMEGHSGSPEPEDWMLVNQEAPSDGAAMSDRRPEAPPALPETGVSYPSLAELAPHPDPKIQRALDHMSAMGYNNAGGWLTNLLEMKQGDINQVLDLLQPVNK